MTAKWAGVFPATTTQFDADESLNLDETQRVIAGLLADGVHGIICLGTVGENCSLAEEEKRYVMAAAKEVVRGRVPLLAGVAETTTKQAAEFARAAERIGVDGLMVLPGMVYKSLPHETLDHFSTVAGATGLPIMIYNNPVSYGIDVTVPMFEKLASLQNVVAIKESSADTRRLVDLRNAYGERFRLFGGVDDFALESLCLGADGWVSGLTNAFPRESIALYELAKAGRYADALAIYQWFMPLLHLDSRTTLVQCIKLVEQLLKRGSEYVRAPRLILDGEERREIEQMVAHAHAGRARIARLVDSGRND